MRMKSISHSFTILVLLTALLGVPLVSLAAPAATVTGTLSYSGSQDVSGHDIIVFAQTVWQDNPEASMSLGSLGTYSLTGVPDGAEYYIGAAIDIHDTGDGPFYYGEPVGFYDGDNDGNPDKIMISGGTVPDINIEIEDPAEYIAGTACYYGGAQGGRIEIGLHGQVNQAPATVQYMYERPCKDYMFSRTGAYGDYYISLFYDLDGSSGPPDPGEPIVYYDGDGDGNPDVIEFSATNSVITGIDITIGTLPILVDFSAAGNDDGTSWDDAFTDLQDALVAAEAGDEIWVASGQYTPGTTRDATFDLKAGVGVYGGFNGTEYLRYNRNPRANVTVLSGEIGDLSVKTDNVYQVVTAESAVGNPITETTVLDGFTISDGYADDFSIDKGGGFYNRYGYPTLVNLNFIDNYAMSHGGALATQDNLVPMKVINCTFSGNSTNFNGAIAVIDGQVEVINSSISGNTGANGGGIVALNNSHVEVHNTILWNNYGNEIGLQGSGATSNVTYSIIDGGYASGTGILTSDPLFVDADGSDNTYGTPDDDLHLQSTSPAIDAGNTSELLTDVGDSDYDEDTTEVTPTDIDGNDRQIDDAATNTGSGTPPVDMGADEYVAPAAISGLSAVTSESVLLDASTMFAARVVSGTHITYAWDFGDGSTGAGGVTSHTYTALGEYQVTVTATNSLGSQVATFAVNVSENLSMDPGDSKGSSDDVIVIELPDVGVPPVDITYTPQNAPVPVLTGNQVFAGVSFLLSAADGSGTPVIVPSESLTMTVQYDESALPYMVSEYSLQVYRYDEGLAQWVALILISRDVADDTITVALDHFSEFAVIGETFKVYVPMVD